ncbi:MAG: CotH kinase family protein [Cyclobacteriaceae bacterium]|nr:CotH kinase family protein [Cyclobacteriaceae bacterium]
MTFLFSVLAVSGYTQVIINEVCPANADINFDPDFFNFSPWVELHNTGNTSVSLGGYYLSDNSNQPAKWVIPQGIFIPAKGYLLIWCDGRNTGLHTSFSLDSDGESVVLSSPALQLVDQVTFPRQYSNVSYGRKSDGNAEWSYLSSPTPAAKNESPFGEVVLDPPTLSVKSGRYAATQNVTITHITPGVEIRYTLDGTEPRPGSALYTAPVPVTKTLTLKAKAFHNTHIPSQTVVETYFINERSFTLPVVSVSTRPDYLWNNTVGIYTIGTNGLTKNCRDTPANWNQDWDRHASISFFDASGKPGYSRSVDISIGGGCSRNNAQKSLNIKARDKYGGNILDDKLFPEKPHDRYGGFTMRNSGNDFNITMFRDALIQTLAKEQMKLNYQAYRPTVFFLNGQYWGIQNMREKIDADYIETNFGIKSNDIDLLESWGSPIEGTNTAYFSYLNTLQTLPPSLPSTYEFIDQHIEVQEYINYLVTQIYFGNTDWPGNNIKFWRQRSNNGKFRWLLYDTDFGLALYGNVTHPTLPFATDPNSGVDWPNPPWSTQHIRLVLQNPQFRSRFIQTMAAAMGAGFSPQQVNKAIDVFSQRIAAEMPFHKQRWGGNMSNWNYEVQRLRTVAAERHQYMRQHMAEFFSLTADVKISAQTFPESTGKINLNGVTLHEPMSMADYYRNLPFEAKPVPAPGYAFKHWKLIKSDVTISPLVSAGDTWKYFDAGVLPGVNWNAPVFNDNAWASGPAQLGYGEGDEQTVVGFGPNANNKFITTYFRKSFTVSGASEIMALNASALFDDGIVVYLNGTEVYRNNMPAGNITNNTLASGAIAVENVFVDFSVPANLLAEGNNVLAVEVHQNSPQSSDLSFAFRLSSFVGGAEEEMILTTPVLSDVADRYVSIEAHFEEAAPVSGLVINEVAAAGTAATDELGEQDDWIEIYNSSAQAIDLAGLFITDNLQSKLKHQFEAGSNKTIINPGEYKLVWADNQTGQSVLHTNFRLSASGEQVGLYQMTGSQLRVLDEVTFAAHAENTSASRIPDITGPIEITAMPTPGAANIFEVVTHVNDDPLTEDVLIYPNPVTDLLHIKSGLNSVVRVRVTNMQGALVHTQHVPGEQVVSLDHLPSGLYLVAIISGSKSYVKRIMKR